MNELCAIALISSDRVLVRALAEQLHLAEGLSVVTHESGTAALEAVGQEPPALYLIDESLSDMPGAALSSELRDRAIALPIMLLTNASDPPPDGSVDAEDLVRRPIRLQALLARIAANLAAGRSSPPNATRIGPFELLPTEKLLIDRSDERRVRLTEKEVAILEHLAAADEPISREALLQDVWGYQSGVTSHTLETHIYRLRQKIESDPSNAAILVNEAGGYRLVP